MKSFMVLAVISMVAMARAGNLIGSPLTTTSIVSPLTTSSLVSPLATSLHQPSVLSSSLIASPSWAGSPLLTRTISTHEALGNPWVGSSSLIAQPTLVHGGIIGARNIW